MLFNISNAVIEPLHDDLFIKKGVSVSVMRLDKIHPVVSGNKVFKLHYFIEEALASSHKTMLSFGGAYSNHLAAMAWACTSVGLKSIGIIRGEEPASLSHTLVQCRENGMQLKFISREEYDKKDEEDFLQHIINEFGPCSIVPEGGYHPLGAKGASLILEPVSKQYTHICTAMGTATTAAGLLAGITASQKLLIVPVLKGVTDIEQRIRYLAGFQAIPANVTMIDQYHFGGYAKRTEALIGFMNRCWEQHQLPLDFVYTAKLFYAITDLVRQDHFPPGADILWLHTGGLQGNGSLPPNTLIF